MTTPPTEPSGAIPPGGQAVPGYPPMGYVVVQQPPPPKKNWFLRHKFLTALAALIVLIVIFMAAKGTKSDDSSSTAAGQSTAAQGSEINQPVRDGKFEFVVTDVAPPVKSIGEGMLTETAQGQFVVVKLTVRIVNRDDSGQSYKADQWSLRRPDNVVENTAYATPMFVTGSTLPGNGEVFGELWFETPVDGRYWLAYRPDSSSARGIWLVTVPVERTQ